LRRREREWYLVVLVARVNIQPARRQKHRALLLKCTPGGGGGMRARARNAHRAGVGQSRLRCWDGWTAWPFWHARCSAVLPNELTRVASAPRLSRYAATCTWPLCAEYLPQYGGPGAVRTYRYRVGPLCHSCSERYVVGRCDILPAVQAPSPSAMAQGRNGVVWEQAVSYRSQAVDRHVGLDAQRFDRFRSTPSRLLRRCDALQRRRPLRRRRVHVRAGLDQPLHRLHMPRLHGGTIGTIEPQRSVRSHWLTG
jgi:hypothetical protein